MPTAGTALVNGFNVTTEADGVRKSIGVIPQAMTSDLELSVEENLLIYAKLYGVPRDKRTRLIRELLQSVELLQWADKQVKHLSGGMRRRVEIARGLVHEPRVFFLDEPTTGLDPVSRVAVWEMLQRIKSRARSDGPADHPLHGRGRQAVRPDRHRRSRRAEGARLADDAQGVGAEPQRARGELRAGARPIGPGRCRTLPDVESVTGHDHVFRISSRNGPATTTALMEAAARAGVPVQSLSVQSTTLDDVFVHFTGRGLRDALQEPSAQDSPFVLRRG